MCFCCCMYVSKLCIANECDCVSVVCIDHCCVLLEWMNDVYGCDCAGIKYQVSVLSTNVSSSSTSQTFPDPIAHSI